MNILSKGQSAPTIITIQLAWHNNNPMIQNMHLNHVLVQEPLNLTYYLFLKIVLPWKYSATNATSAIKICAGDIKNRPWLCGTHFAFEIAP